MKLSPLKIVAGATILLCGTIATNAQSLPGSPEAPLSPQQALANQGQNVTVEGIAHVSEAAGLPGIFVRLVKPGSAAPFAGYIDIDNERAFPDPGQLDGKRIEISGVVEIYNSLPMIRLTSPAQIRVVG